MAKIILTRKSILEKEKYGILYFFLSIFAIVGTVVSINAIITMIKDINVNTIITAIFITGVFGIPFGYLIGIKKVLYTVRKKNKIKRGDYTIIVDEIEDLYTTMHGRTSDGADNYCHIRLKRYSAINDKSISIPFKEFKKLQMGDQCILLFTNLNKRPFRVYPGNQYVLDEELETKIV